MPDRKHCRHCGSADIFRKEVPAGGGMVPSLLPVGMLVGAHFRLEVCAGCGLVEWFVPQRFLPAVRESFDPY